MHIFYYQATGIILIPATPVIGPSGGTSVSSEQAGPASQIPGTHAVPPPLQITAPLTISPAIHRYLEMLRRQRNDDANVAARRTVSGPVPDLTTPPPPDPRLHQSCEALPRTSPVVTVAPESLGAASWQFQEHPP